MTGKAPSNAPLASATAANLLVLKIEFHASGTSDNVSLFINPSLSNPSVAPTTASVTLTGTDFGTLNAMGFTFGGGDKKPIFDEFRVGDSFTAVVPEPASLGLLGLGGIALLRRRSRSR